MTSGESYFDTVVASIADERYEGDSRKAFALLAFQLSFPTNGFTDDEAEEATSVDRKGDLGADAVFISEDEKRALLFQAKSSIELTETVLHDEITSFLAVPTKLFSDKWVEKAHEEMKALANEFRVAVSSGYDIVLVFCTGSKLTETVRSTFLERTDIKLGNYETTAETILLDHDELEGRYHKLLLGEYGAPTNVAFKVASGHLHVPKTVPRVAYLTLEAREFVSECVPHKNELFRHNPRLYLGANKVNHEIGQTLRSTTQRSWFHLLNNGVTAVCRDFTIADLGDDGYVIKVDNFQIVNGCQTTMTLIDNSNRFQDESSCLLDVKVIQEEGLRDLISLATNTQTAIVAADTFSNEPEQKHIADVLSRFSPPYFYAPGRGMWEAPETKKKMYTDSDWPFGRNLKLTSKELASVFLAIFGEPGAAKDRVTKIVFDKPDGKFSPEYSRIFQAHYVAVQWLLPFELYRCANTVARQESRENPESVRARVAKYARYAMVNLSYSFLSQMASEPEHECLSAERSDSLFGTIKAWGPRLAELSLDALTDAYEEARENKESSGLREFFRENTHQERISAKFQRVIVVEKRSATRDGETIQDRLKLPSLKSHRVR